MTAPKPHVVPIFATPFGMAAVPEAEALNPAVAALLAARATPERADPANRQAFTYRSRDDLLDWTDAAGSHADGQHDCGGVARRALHQRIQR